MRRRRLLAIAFLVAGFAGAASASAFANILIQIDKPSQSMVQVASSKAKRPYKFKTKFKRYNGISAAELPPHSELTGKDH